MKNTKQSIFIIIVFLILPYNVLTLHISDKKQKNKQKNKSINNLTSIIINNSNKTNITTPNSEKLKKTKKSKKLEKIKKLVGGNKTKKFDIDLNVSINLDVQDNLEIPKKIEKLRDIRDYLLLKDKYFKEKIHELLKLNQELAKNNSDFFILLNATQSEHKLILKEIEDLKSDNEDIDITEGETNLLESTQQILNQLTEFNITHSLVSILSDNQNNIVKFMKSKIKDISKKQKIIYMINKEIENYLIPKIHILIEAMEILNNTQKLIDQKYHKAKNYSSLFENTPKIPNRNLKQFIIEVDN